MLKTPMSAFLSGAGIGLAAASWLFYIIHMEATLGMQRDWLAQQHQAEQARQATPQAAIETIDLLMKAYSVSVGTEEQNIQPLLEQNGHIQLLNDVQQRADVDISDLLQANRPFTAAQLYAALLRIKQQHEKQQAQRLLTDRLNDMVIAPQQ